jgi:hypothetical protein
MKNIRLLLIALLLLACTVGYAQRTPDYDKVVVLQTRIDARDLGYPPADVIPDGESGITSLVVAPNGNLYGATSGARSHLFVLIPRHGYVQPLGVIPGATSVTNALVISSSGDIYIGTAPGGHLLEYKPHDEYAQLIQIGRPLPVTDLGQAVPGESILALAIGGSTIVGLTSPNAHLFEYSIPTGTFTDIGVVADKAPGAARMGEKFETEKMMSRMLIGDATGSVWGSGESGSLFRHWAGSKQIGMLRIQAPAIPGREPWTRVDAFVADPSGMIYGGTSDGYLFRLDPEKETISNLGKPLIQYRIDGLVRAPDGKIYGVGGGKDDMARLFSYNPSTGAYDLLGFIDVNRRPYYTWQAYVIGAIASDRLGTIYIGENERISKLYLFYPWP